MINVLFGVIMFIIGFMMELVLIPGVTTHNEILKLISPLIRLWPVYALAEVFHSISNSFSSPRFSNSFGSIPGPVVSAVSCFVWRGDFGRCYPQFIGDLPTSGMGEVDKEWTSNAHVVPECHAALAGTRWKEHFRRDWGQEGP